MNAKLVIVLAFSLASAAVISKDKRQSLRGVFDDIFDKSDSAEHVDPMDSYIKASKSHNSDNVWWSDMGSKPQKDAPVKPMSEFRDDKSVTDITGETQAFKPFKPSNSMFNAPEPSSSLFAPSDVPASHQFTPSSSMFAASDAPVAQPYKSNSQSSEGGAVVNIKLDSELQESLLQSRKRGSAGSHGRTNSAPNVEAAVESERLEDVYIHDEFSKDASDDTQKEQEVNANRDMKA
mmetsp:Transcript_28454/g.45698  ORF Transcript_28454/g.45698 Transcript_28454/m.45698 type:complete len:235 (+) Transcript_28454:68-772(+)